MDPHVDGGHRVCPIEWDSEQQAWIIHEVVTATTVKVYDNVMPLRMKAPEGRYGSQDFDRFVSRIFNPMIPLLDAEPQAGLEPESEPKLGATPDPLDPSYSEVERIVGKRVENGITQYRVKWIGHSNRYNA